MVVADDFLLQVAGISASLLGFFVVGVFFFVQRGMFPEVAEHAQRYLQAATGTIIVLYGLILFLSLALVVAPLQWVSVLYLVFSAVLLWSVWRTSVAVSRLHRLIPLRLTSQLGLWLAAAALVAAPWIPAGFAPSRNHFAVAIAIAGLFAFASTASLVLFAFEISRLEAEAGKAASRMRVTEGKE